MSLQFSRRVILLIVLIVLALAVPLTLFLLSQQQDVRQHAAGSADLAVSSVELTDAGGNVRTVFGTGEDIYVRITLKNQGSATGVSSDGHTYTAFYANKKDDALPNDPSDVGITLRNGEFSSGYKKTYESRWNGTNDSFYNDKIFFSESKGGTYHARVYVNYNGKVAESNLLNNQLDLTYTVTGKYISNGIYLDGDVSSNPPAGFSSVECGQAGTRSNISVCYLLGPLNGKSVVKLTNNGSTVQTVGATVWKAYYDYPSTEPTCSQAACPEQYVWLWTQTVYSAQTTSLDPGETAYISLPIPGCNWQVDASVGSAIWLSFHPNSGRNYTYIGGGWLEQYNGTQACKPIVPSPTPTSTPTPTLPPDVPTPTITLTPTPTLTETPAPSETPTPTVPVCPVPSQVQNVRIVCPFCGQ